MSTDKQLQDFKNDLAELLVKHEAYLTYIVGGYPDIYDEGIGVAFFGSSEEETRLCDAHGLGPSDLTED